MLHAVDERLLFAHLDADNRIGMMYIDGQNLRRMDGSAYFPRNIVRGKRKLFVGTAGFNFKGARPLSLQYACFGDSRRGNSFERFIRRLCLRPACNAEKMIQSRFHPRLQGHIRPYIHPSGAHLYVRRCSVKIASKVLRKPPLKIL